MIGSDTQTVRVEFDFKAQDDRSAQKILAVLIILEVAAADGVEGVGGGGFAVGVVAGGGFGGDFDAGIVGDVVVGDGDAFDDFDAC